MIIDILTLFPEMFRNVLGESMLKRAQNKGLVKIRLHNLRDWTYDRHHSADDKPFGGGAGMVMKVEPVYGALKELGLLKASSKKAKVILLTPQGRQLNQAMAKKLVREERLALICGHYEGVDERIREFADYEISVGDYVLTCGEIPAMVLTDCVTRLIPGVLGHDESVKFESFEDGMLEYPQYTRPAEFNGMSVPQILLSGDHKKIDVWRREEAFKRTLKRRPDLMKKKE